MKGLFLNSFYEAWNNLRVVGILILVFGIGVICSGNATLAELFPYITISAFAVSSIATLRKDSVSQWNKYELTLPIKRKNIISGKYISYIFWTLCGLAVSAVIVFITLIAHENLFAYGLRDCFSLFSLGMGLAIIAGAIFYPLAILCGADKSEILLAISVVLSICTSITIINAVNILKFSYAARLIIFNLAYVLIYAISYLLSKGLYANKEL